MGHHPSVTYTTERCYAQLVELCNPSVHHSDAAPYKGAVLNGLCSTASDFPVKVDLTVIAFFQLWMQGEKVSPPSLPSRLHDHFSVRRV